MQRCRKRRVWNSQFIALNRSKLVVLNALWIVAEVLMSLKNVTYG